MWYIDAFNIWKMKQVAATERNNLKLLQDLCIFAELGPQNCRNTFGAARIFWVASAKVLEVDDWNFSSLKQSTIVLNRPQRWIITIPSFDQWLAPIENYRKTIGCNGCQTKWLVNPLKNLPIGWPMISYHPIPLKNRQIKPTNHWPFHHA